MKKRCGFCRGITVKRGSLRGTYVHAETCERPMPIMVECDHCGGDGEHQAECEDCHVRLTTKNQDAEEPERCNICGSKARLDYGPKDEEHEHNWTALTLSQSRHHRRICRNAYGVGCKRIEIFAPCGSHRHPTTAWREARGDEAANPKAANLTVQARWAKMKRHLAGDMGIPTFVRRAG